MAIAEALHIDPWTQRERLTVTELRMAIAYVQELKRRADKASRG